LKPISEKGEKYLIETPGSYYKRQASQTDRTSRKTVIGRLLILKYKIISIIRDISDYFKILKKNPHDHDNISKRKKMEETK